MIHINTVNINVQMPCDEPGPTSVLGDALLHAMAESLFAQQSEEGLDSKVEVQPLTNPPRMNSQQQRADAWMAVCAMLNEVCPGWCSGPGSSAQENAVEAIRAMAKAR